MVCEPVLSLTGIAPALLAPQFAVALMSTGMTCAEADAAASARIATATGDATGFMVLSSDFAVLVQSTAGVGRDNESSGVKEWGGTTPPSRLSGWTPLKRVSLHDARREI